MGRNRQDRNTGLAVGSKHKPGKSTTIIDPFGPWGGKIGIFVMDYPMGSNLFLSLQNSLYRADITPTVRRFMGRIGKMVESLQRENYSVGGTIRVDGGRVQAEGSPKRVIRGGKNGKGGKA